MRELHQNLQKDVEAVKEDLIAEYMANGEANALMLGAKTWLQRNQLIASF